MSNFSKTYDPETATGSADPEGSAPPTDPLEAFAGLLAQTPSSDHAKLIAAVKMKAMNQGEIPEFVPLLSGEEWAARVRDRIAAANELIDTAGYRANVLRLLDLDENAQAARDGLESRLVETLGVAPATAADLLTMAATGISGDDEVFDLTGEIVAPTWHTQGRWYQGRLHNLFGRDGTNKTTLLAHDACEAALRGERSLIFEYEMGVEAFKQLVHDLGYDRDEMDRWIRVVEPREAFSSGLLLRHLARWPDVTMIGLDNLSEAIASGGEDSEDSSMDVLRIMGLLRNVAHDRNICVITLDHLPHHRTDAARGSTAKAQIVDVAFSVEAKPPVTRTRPGKLKLTCRKDRPSLIGKGHEVWLDIGDGQGGLPIAAAAAPPREGNVSENQGKMIRALREWEESNPGDPGLSQNAALREAGLSKNVKNVDELDKLANDPEGPVHRTSIRKGDSVSYQYRYVPVEVSDDGFDL